jgi:hypothetical protein
VKPISVLLYLYRFCRFLSVVKATADEKSLEWF